jgi:hypothetical protein
VNATSIKLLFHPSSAILKAVSRAYGRSFSRYCVSQQISHLNNNMTAQTPLIVVLSELRKTVRVLALSVCLATLVIFFLTPQLLQGVQSHLSDKIVFFRSG